MVDLCESDFPLSAARAGTEAAIAILTAVDGPSYRPLGAAMVVGADGSLSGTLSSGCIHRDVALHAGEVIRTGTGKRLVYGRGSRFMDIVLPCGGRIEVTVVPLPATAVLDRALAGLARRRHVDLVLTEDLRLDDAAGSGILCLRLHPEIRLVVVGKGPEASGFATLARGAGYPVDLWTLDEATREAAGFGRLFTGPDWASEAVIDARTAVCLFLHDHDAEPPLLATALASSAFFIGAQGSRRAHSARCAALLRLGVAPAALDRLAAPFGLIPSTRDPRTLAISVLAQVVSVAGSSLAGASPEAGPRTAYAAGADSPGARPEHDQTDPLSAGYPLPVLAADRRPRPEAGARCLPGTPG